MNWCRYVSFDLFGLTLFIIIINNISPVLPALPGLGFSFHFAVFDVILICSNSFNSLCKHHHFTVVRLALFRYDQLNFVFSHAVSMIRGGLACYSFNVLLNSLIILLLLSRVAALEEHIANATSIVRIFFCKFHSRSTPCKSNYFQSWFCVCFSYFKWFNELLTDC